MIETVTTAIHEAQQEKSATKESVARAAITAMRVPNLPMMKAAIANANNPQGDMWRAMIDAALNPTPSMG